MFMFNDDPTMTHSCGPLAIVQAWKLKYLGDAYKTLLQAVDDVHMLPEANHYAKILPIAQSSGTGKSKTVDRAAMERVLFPICLRENLGENYFGAKHELYIVL